MRPHVILIALVPLGLATLPIAAEEHATYPGLPGVTKPKPLVQPMPEETEEDRSQADPRKSDGRSFRVGAWDVKVGGELTIEFGTTRSHRR